jgi:Fe2+ or Zn2+ uptake regulation protein
MKAVHHHEEHVHDDIEQRLADILELLRADGGRVTTGRRFIVQALLTAPDHHVTAESVAAVVHVEAPDVHLSTVYRTLDSLERLGIVGRVNLGQAGAVYHLTDHTHDHLVCEGCGAVTEVPADVMSALRTAVKDRYGFTVTPRLSVTGLCEACMTDLDDPSDPAGEGAGGGGQR